MQHVLRGRGSLNGANLAALMEALAMQKPMLVCGRRMQETLAARMDVSWPVFGGYHPNPDLEDCVAGAELYREMGCDGLISIGGGSAMDTAKGIKALLLTNDWSAVTRSEVPADTRLPHIAIPSTAGTGAEATPFAVVYVKKKKLTINHPSLLPEATVLDSSLLDTLPQDQRRACAMDVLAQGIESYWAVSATQESRQYAVRAIRGVLRSYTAYLGGDFMAQEDMLDAAWQSGMAITISRTTAAHALNYELVKRRGYPHGLACMMTLPVLWTRLARQQSMRPMLMEMLRNAGVSEFTDGAAMLRGMLVASNLDSLEPADDALLDALTASVDVTKLTNHPEPLTSADVRQIYADALTPIPDWARESAVQAWRKACSMI